MEKNILCLKLKRFREEKGITQQELAEILEVSDKSISKWELGNGYPSKRNMLKISEILDISVETLLIEEKNDDKEKVKLSIKYSLISYIIIFTVTLIIRGLASAEQYQNILSKDIIEIFKLLASEFVQNIGIALLPAIIIGFVFYFYIFPKQSRE
ncbi:helix-turn-helix domain-containing protein [Lysinibacillus sp. Ag94]|uniref:helix-turn-helix domain-containing protein n=1 Tax=Lysinibacillus sp. Ag94 TaxID=2936682 RepID=UPI00200C1804|nr:helix-turn-helix transcriptional regulator [Lysinibacillus sp. Ag94]UPW83129.1 helix-turn-helix domain-containing protein [Lysinibacillus sp. Ag94]